MSAFNGSGTFVITGTGLPYVTGTTISSTVANQLNADLATGLSTTITKDGQTTPTANIPMGGFKITGLGQATASGNAVAAGSPIFVGTLITTSQTVSGITKVQFNSIRIDNGGYWDAVNFWYKPLLAGTYEVSGSAYCSNVAGTITGITVTVSKNGTTGSGGAEVIETNMNGVSVGAIGNTGTATATSYIAMNGSTDTLELDVAVVGTGTLSINAVRSATQLAIRWVGP